MPTKEDRLLDTAYGIFYRYGYNRVTMNEIAETAGISRQALYLMFNSKEEIFNAAILRKTEATIAEIRKQIRKIEDPAEALRKVLYIWAIQYFDKTQDSPEARELIEASKESSKYVSIFGTESLEGILAELIRPNEQYSSLQIAHLINYSVKGLKETAKDSEELSQLVEQLLCMFGL